MKTIIASGLPSPGTAIPLPPFLQKGHCSISAAIFLSARSLFTRHPVPGASFLSFERLRYMISDVSLGSTQRYYTILLPGLRSGGLVFLYAE
jgi:hypothetical protein